MYIYSKSAQDIKKNIIRRNDVWDILTKRCQSEGSLVYHHRNNRKGLLGRVVKNIPSLRVQVYGHTYPHKYDNTKVVLFSVSMNSVDPATEARLLISEYERRNKQKT